MEVINASDWVRPDVDAAQKARAVAASILADVQARGEDAVREHSLAIDGFEPRVLELEPWRNYPLTEETRKHMDLAAERIQQFAEMQFSMYRDLEREDRYGRYGQRVVPLDRMAAYIPGGRFPLVSTALMTLIPARVAGVGERVAVSPGDAPEIRAAASRAGATSFVHLGGAQAIAALAIGTGLQASVDMIVGPGNAYVNAAKALVQDRVQIDTLAGPSEILVLCDDSIDPEWVAFDVLAQAEHDPMALSVLASTSDSVLTRVAQVIERESKACPEKDTGLIQLVLCSDVDQMVALSNRMAPEHLQLACKPGEVDPLRLRHYGSLFIGAHSAVALGDYCTGPNHTLPTMACARRKGGLQVGDFLKILTWQEIAPDHYGELAQTAIHLAGIEKLDFHRRSLEVRR